MANRPWLDGPTSGCASWRFHPGKLKLADEFEEPEDALRGGDGVRALTLSFSDTSSNGPTWMTPTPEAADVVPPDPNAFGLKT
jgi:hypothetical protein